jgi:cytochrome c oxidase subunit 2
LDEVISPTITIKVTASQWFWSYEYSDYITDSGDAISFDSCYAFWENVILGQTIKLRGTPKTYGTKL